MLRFFLTSLLQAVTPRMVRDVCTKYIYDKCPAVAAVGAFFVVFVLLLEHEGPLCNDFL